MVLNSNGLLLPVFKIKDKFLLCLSLCIPSSPQERQFLNMCRYSTQSVTIVLKSHLTCKAIANTIWISCSFKYKVCFMKHLFLFSQFYYFYYPLAQRSGHWLKIWKTFSSLLCLNGFKLLLLNPNSVAIWIECTSVHLAKGVEEEKGQLWPRNQSFPWMRQEVVSHLMLQWVWGRTNRLGMVWKTANWKAITSTWEKSTWIPLSAAEILF